MTPPDTSAEAVADLVQILHAWHANSPNPDYFQGEPLMAIISTCGDAADTLAAVVKERDAERVRAARDAVFALRDQWRFAVIKEEARADAADRRLAEARAEAEAYRRVLDSYRRIGFHPCKDPACYRKTLDMMQQSDAILCDWEARALLSGETTI